MSLTEQSTDGRTGMEVAKKFESGDMQQHVNTYNGFGRGSSSLQHVTEKSRRPEQTKMEDK